MPDHARVVRVITFTAAGDDEALLNELKKQVQELSSVPGCFGAQVTRSREAPGTYIARWESDEALQRHRQTPEFEQARERLKHLVKGPVEIRHYDSI